jgi:hypothetical protein
LPFDQFAFSELKTEGKEQRLRLVFATHEVLLNGHSLRRIETAMQQMELSLLTALRDKQRLLVPDGQPVVREIVVSEIKDAERYSPFSNTCHQSEIHERSEVVKPT